MVRASVASLVDRIDYYTDLVEIQKTTKCRVATAWHTCELWTRELRQWTEVYWKDSSEDEAMLERTSVYLSKCPRREGKRCRLGQ